MACLALFSASASFLSASTFVALESRELVAESQRVVQGRVLDLQSFWNEDGRMIFTEATVAVDETLVGAERATVVVRVPGGTVGDLRVEASGFPRFALGQEVILFLSPSADGRHHRVVGHQQGHFEVVRRDDGVRLAVPQIDEGARLLTRSGRPIDTPRSTELDAFKQAVLTLAGRPGPIVE
ncbi:MAG: hypothetical protein DWQ36_10845 [Acidobacteria bacterium]|nr:MAG: hypothetical protein DWQ30_12555 [Acidobacteriota bacterium]REK07710.1 MAG: hypothetical protein DWQ36_10845 [Acidobacteriota bacterium]